MFHVERCSRGLWPPYAPRRLSRPACARPPETRGYSPTPGGRSSEATVVPVLPGHARSRRPATDEDPPGPPSTHSSVTAASSPAITGRADARQWVVGWPDHATDQHLYTGVTPDPLAPDRPANIRSHHHASCGRPGDASAMDLRWRARDRSRADGLLPATAVIRTRRQVPHPVPGTHAHRARPTAVPSSRLDPASPIRWSTGGGRRRFRLMSHDRGPRPPSPLRQAPTAPRSWRVRIADRGVAAAPPGQRGTTLVGGSTARPTGGSPWPASWKRREVPASTGISGVSPRHRAAALPS